MKVKISSLPLLIIGSLTVSGLREHPSQKLAQEAVCRVRCEIYNKSCLNECSSHPRHIPVLETGAKANIQYICHATERSMLMKLDYGVFTVEYRHQSNADWIDDKVVFFDDVHGAFAPTLYINNPYQLRFTRASADGISNSETTDWFPLQKPGVRSGKVLDMRLHCLSRNKVSLHRTTWQLTAQIVLIPREGITCVYYIKCVGDNYETGQKIHFMRRERKEATFENLPFGSNVTVTAVSVSNGSRTEEAARIEFSTPRFEELRNSVCVPDKVEDIEASVMANNDGNIHDVNVTWRTRNYVPDYFIVNITTDGAESNETRVSSHNDRKIRSFYTIFKDMKISQKYDVSISGYSDYFGGGPETSKRFDLTQKTIGSPDTMTVIAVLSCMSSVVTIGVCAYLMLRRQRQRQKKTKVSSMDHWEIVPGRLVVSRILGTGAFGIVKLGKLRDNEGQDTNVAVKMLRDNTNETELRYFFLEIEMMKSLGSHPNIVSLLDYRTVDLFPFLVLEYCPGGDLLAFLHSIFFETPTTPENEKEEPRLSRTETSGHDANFQENSEGSPATPEFSSDATLTVLDMLNFGRQIATGMEFLSSNRIVHCDLAARNVLLCDDRVLKISDFGLSRDIYQQNMYRKTGNGRMPLKWMAIESLTHQVFTTRSDAWSFGILLWEIFTLGGTPYPEIPAIELLKVLQSGYRMKRPENCSKAMFNLMLACWETKPKNRPTFTYLREELDKLICMASDNEYLDTDDLSLGAPTCMEEGPKTSSTTSNSHDTTFSLQVDSAAVE